MNVYRIEHKENKRGPFQNWALHPFSPEADMPAPTEDGTFDINEYYDLQTSGKLQEYRYGFPSKMHLTDVFSDTERLVNLLRKGYAISEYVVPEEKVKEGEAQCAFKPTDAKFKRWVPVRDLKTLH